MHAGVIAYMRGDWDLALELADYSAENPPPTPRAMLDAVRLAWRPAAVRSPRWLGVPALRERWHREGMIAVVGGGAAIELLSMRDGAADAVAMYDDICEVIVPLWAENFGARLRLATLGIAALADEAPRTPSAGRDEVRATAQRLRDDAERVIASRETANLRDRGQGLGGALAGRAAASRLAPRGEVDLAEMVGRWRETADLFAELGHRLEEARARTRLAAVLRAVG